MKRILLSSLALLAWLVLPAALFAQGPYQRPQTNPYARPVFSPYLNLLRSGSNPAINYYGLVRPEIDFRNSINSLQQQVNAQYAATAGEETPGAIGTGHSTQFGNLSHYFNYQGGAQGGRRPGASVITPTIPTGGQSGGAAGQKPARTR